MRILVVDDEELARLRLTRFLGDRYPDWEVREARDGFEALDTLATWQPDLMFLDIEMPEMTGFELLLQLENRPFALVFQTAYDQFAVKAFEESAVDYLLKPFTDERLEAALKKARYQRADLSGLEKSLLDRQGAMRQLVIKAGNRHRVIPVADIIYFLSEAHVTRIFLKDVDYVHDRSLSWLEERLDPALFVRTHRNSIVRLDAIESFQAGQKAEVRLRGGTVLAVSRERKKDLAKALGIKTD